MSGVAALSAFISLRRDEAAARYGNWCGLEGSVTAATWQSGGLWHFIDRAAESSDAGTTNQQPLVRVPSVMRATHAERGC